MNWKLFQPYSCNNVFQPKNKYVERKICALQRKSPLLLPGRLFALAVAVVDNFSAHSSALILRDYLALVQIVVKVIEPDFLCHNVLLTLVFHYGPFPCSFSDSRVIGSLLFIIGIGVWSQATGSMVFFPSISAF